MPIIFNPKDWYWSVAGDANNVYSSARNIYVPTSDTGYTTWLTNNGLTEAQPISNEEAIWYYVKDFQPLWLWDDAAKKVSQPAVDQYTKQQLQNYNATVRFDKVTGGMTAAGVPVKTDDRSRGLIADAANAARADDTFTAKWFGSDGNFYPVDAATMISLADTVARHTNDCYTVFEQVSSQITSLAITTLTQIDDAYSGL